LSFLVQAYPPGEPINKGGAVDATTDLQELLLGCWKRAKRGLPANPLKLSHNFFPRFLASKK